MICYFESGRREGMQNNTKGNVFYAYFMVLRGSVGKVSPHVRWPKSLCHYIYRH
jgi:hypothetical protein